MSQREKNYLTRKELEREDQIKQRTREAQEKRIAKQEKADRQKTLRATVAKNIKAQQAKDAKRQAKLGNKGSGGWW